MNRVKYGSKVTGSNCHRSYFARQLYFTQEKAQPINGMYKLA